MTKQEEEEILSVFPDADLEIIKTVIFFDGWSDYEENGGYLIFIGIDDTIQTCSYGYSVMSSDNTNYFNPQETTVWEMADIIEEIKHRKDDTPKWDEHRKYCDLC